MNPDINRLVRPHLLHLAPYASARDEFSGTAKVFLDANENPYGDPNGEAWNRYPDPHQRSLKAKLAQMKGVTTDQIFLGNGSDEAIDLLIRAFCEPAKDKILIAVPTYGMYQVSATVNHVEVIEVLLSEDFQLRAGSLLKSVEQNTKIIFLCSPNNPTGNLLYPANVETILESFSGLVVVDEAYIDYTSSKSWINQLSKYPNLVVLQTFSKAWGMAALRLGAAYAQPAIINFLNKIKPPYNVNAYTQRQALAALENEGAFRRNLEQSLEEREKLRAELEKLPIVKKIYPTEANFILIKVLQANQVYQYLLKNEVVIRNRSKVVLCDDCLRITVGSFEENQLLIAALKEWVLN